MLQLVRIVEDLPEDFPALRAEAKAEGWTHIERLALDWAIGTVRFEKDGEALFAAFIGGELAGMGGMTVDPIDPTASRMRKFFVRRDFREQGVARALAGALMQESAHARRGMTLRADETETPGFWEALGFRPDPGPDGRRAWTHRLPAPDS
jgi:GNAT superfamily N-acetyltransferase